MVEFYVISFVVQGESEKTLPSRDMVYFPFPYMCNTHFPLSNCQKDYKTWPSFRPAQYINIFIL